MWLCEFCKLNILIKSVPAYVKWFAICFSLEIFFSHNRFSIFLEKHLSELTKIANLSLPNYLPTYSKELMLPYEGVSSGYLWV